MTKPEESKVIFVGGTLYIRNLSEIAEIFHEWELDGTEPESFHSTRWNMYADFYLNRMIFSPAHYDILPFVTIASYHFGYIWQIVADAHM